MAVDMFLKIDGIEGDSKDAKHKGEIDILSYSWGISNQTSGGGGGGGTGKPSVSDFSIVKQMDKTSPELMEKVCQGDHISSVLITLAKGENRQDFFKIKLTDVLISSYQTGGSNSGGGVPMESVSFSFASVDLSAADRRGQFVSQASCDFGKGGGNVIGHEHD